MGDEALPFSQRERAEIVRRRPNRQLGDLRDGPPPQLHRQTLRPEPRAFADGAELQQGKILVFIVLQAAWRHRVPDAVAGRAGAVRAVEGKDAGRDLRIAHAAPHASELLAVEHRLVVLREHAH